jgi:hypothetical protein
MVEVLPMTRDDLLPMDWHERAELARALAALSDPGPVPPVLHERRRRRLAVALTVCCLGLIPWIAFLAVTLPARYQAAQWRTAWTGFDVALLASLAVTAWAVHRDRQVMILAGFVTATLLICDAWFDVLLDTGSDAIWVSLASALLLELPLATLLILVSRRLLMLTIGRAWRLAGQAGPAPSLAQLPILGIASAARPHYSVGATPSPRPHRPYTGTADRRLRGLT